MYNVYFSLLNNVQQVTITQQNWDPIIRKLIKAGHYAIELQGCGESKLEAMKTAVWAFGPLDNSESKRKCEAYVKKHTKICKCCKQVIK